MGNSCSFLPVLQSRAGVVVIAATNRPDHVDSALLRPGRFDRLLYVPRPDALARTAIFAVHTKATPLAADVDLNVSLYTLYVLLYSPMVFSWYFWYLLQLCQK